MKYCEGSKAAEITFSLSGGREGRLMSYSPPVEINVTNGCKATVITAIGFDVNRTLTTDGILFFPGWSKPPGGSTSLINLDGFFSEGHISAPVPNNFYVYRFENETVLERYTYVDSYGYVIVGYLSHWINRIYQKDITTDLVSLFYSSGVIRSGSSITIALDFYNDRYLENALIISDTTGIIYCHEVPKGLTPTWQVKCIGCNAGECAGSDGKGGVICMDCKQMQADIQSIRSKLR